MGYKIKRILVGTQQVRPSVPATAITLNKSSISLTTAGQTSQLTATLTPSGSTSTVSWSSSNTSIATVSSSGLVTCVTPGSCTITATTSNGLTATCSVSGYIYSYSLDFRSKTTSQLVNEGWSIPSGVSIDSSKGIYASSAVCILSNLSGLNSALQNAKKVTITMTKQSNSGSGNEAGFMIIYTTSSLRFTGIYTDTGVSSGFQISCGGTSVYTADDNSWTGKYTITTVYDLVSKKVSINYPGLYNTEASITDSQITNMKTAQGLRVKVAGSYIQDISILIE